jgi:hypothetical protein
MSTTSRAALSAVGVLRTHCRDRRRREVRRVVAKTDDQNSVSA